MKKIFHIHFLIILGILFTKVNAQCVFPVFSSGTFNCLTGQAPGEYTLNGSVPPHTFTIVNSITTATFFAGTVSTNTGTFNTIPAGNYNVYGATSVPGCTFATNFVVTSPFNPGNISFTTSPSCSNVNSGIASAIISGPYVAPYTCTWTSGSFSQTATNLAPGIYTVAITDNAGCSMSNTVQISQTPPVNSTASNTHVSCFGGTLSTVITSTGGTSPYTYTVNGSAIGSNTATGLSAGVSTFVTSDLKGCLKTNTILISQAPQPLVSFNVTQPSCPSSSNGAVSALVSNAPSPFNFTWQPTGAITSGINNIYAGNYTVTVKDGSACITKSLVNVSPATSMSAGILTTSENCSAADGAFTLNISGGQAPYTFSTVSVGNHSNNFLSGLSSGVYTTIVTDANNCSDTIKTVVGNLSNVSVSIVNSAAPLCYSQCSGSVQVSVQNAVPPVTYSASGTSTGSSNMITNLCAGLITVKVIDANGCPATTTVNFPVPPVFSYSAANPAPVCIGKTFTLQGSASGGAGGYTYVWNPGAVTGQTVSLTSGATTVYSLNVYDSNNCTLEPFTVTVNINPPISISLDAVNSGICPGTTAQITPTVSGGDGNYVYNWLPGNLTSPAIYVENITVPVYTLSVNDACGSPTAVKQITVNLFPVTIPTYSVSLNEGCQPLCTQFANTTPKTLRVIWNYGDRPFEQEGETSNYCYEKPGNFNLKMTVIDSNSCKASFTYTNAVKVLIKPLADFITDPPVLTTKNCERVLLKNTSLYGTQFEWFVEGQPWGSAKNIEYSFADTGCVMFELVATDAANRCNDTLERAICVQEGFNFWMPDCFTPNDDGINDVLMPVGTAWEESDYLFEVYNRWGKRIFKSNDITASWDGKTKDGSDPFNRYFWRVRVKDNLNNEHEFKGFVLVLR